MGTIARQNNDKQEQLGGKGIMEIKVLGPGCRKCEKLENDVRQVAEELGLEDKVIKISDLGEIADHGVFLTPALIINGEIKTSGKIPKKAEIKKWLQDAKDS